MKALSTRLANAPVSATARLDDMAKNAAARGIDVISFCVGEPDFDTPQAARDAGIAAIKSGRTHYTSVPGTRALKDGIRAAHLAAYGVSYAADEIAVTAGAKFAVYAAVQALIDPGDEVLLPAPYWTSYREIILLAGGVPVIVPCCAEDGFCLRIDRLIEAITRKTKALILNNPNNPSGAVYGRAELAAIAAVCQKHDLYVIADEIYASLVYDHAQFCSFASLDADAKRRTVTVNGASKSFAMTGWRIGYAAGERDIIRAMTALMSHSTGCASSVGQEAALAAFQGAQADAERMRDAFEARRNLLVQLLAGIGGVSCRAPAGAFYLLLDVRPFLRAGRMETDMDFAVQLLKQAGVAVVPCAEFGLPGYVRLAYTQDESRLCAGVERIRKFIEAQAGEGQI